jgi:hypothetical protein
LACIAGNRILVKGIFLMQNLRSVVIIASISILLVAIATTHAMAVMATAFSVGSVAIFAVAAIFGVATKLRA